jgi:hypothetical protein
LVILDFCLADVALRCLLSTGFIARHSSPVIKGCETRVGGKVPSRAVVAAFGLRLAVSAAKDSAANRRYWATSRSMMQRPAGGRDITNNEGKAQPEHSRSRDYRIWTDSCSTFQTQPLRTLP